MAVEAIIDASALLTLLQKQSGHRRVGQLIGRCGMSAVSLADVVGALYDAGLDADIVDELVDLSIEIIPMDAKVAHIAGKLVPLTVHRGLSSIDRCALATAYLYDVPVVTSERAWSKLKLAELDIEVVR